MTLPEHTKVYVVIPDVEVTAQAHVVMLDLLFLRRAFRGRYLLIAAERGILGRDILDHVTLLLDGPRQQWSEHSV